MTEAINNPGQHLVIPDDALQFMSPDLLQFTVLDLEQSFTENVPDQTVTEKSD